MTDPSQHIIALHGLHNVLLIEEVLIIKDRVKEIYFD